MQVKVTYKFGISQSRFGHFDKNSLEKEALVVKMKHKVKINQIKTAGVTGLSKKTDSTCRIRTK